MSPKMKIFASRNPNQIQEIYRKTKQIPLQNK